MPVPLKGNHFMHSVNPMSFCFQDLELFSSNLFSLVYKCALMSLTLKTNKQINKILIFTSNFSLAYLISLLSFAV